MDVILKVLEGAKSGGKIAIKKDKFFIGRSKKCNLCAGTSSISRRHCVIMRQDASVTVKDLGSRNGTLVNGKRIEKEFELHSGDELAMGPLRFLVTISHGISNLKRAKVQSVADAAERTADSGQADVQEDDISSWLLGPEPSSAMTETQTIRLDDTNAAEMQKAMKDLANQDPEEAETTVQETIEQQDATQSETDLAETESAETADIEENSKKSKSKKKKGPGKLPPIPNKPDSKDSREEIGRAHV